MSSNLTVQGIRVKNSPQFNFRFDGCRNVHIESIYITAPQLSPNTDGIHIENTNGVKIYNSLISNGQSLSIFFKNSPPLVYCIKINTLVNNYATAFSFIGDDCVSIGSGCYDVDIKNITCGPSHGIR